MATRMGSAPFVLLVNDAGDEREMYARTLRAGGYCAVIAGTSAAAYEIATSTPVDLIVTDLHITRSMSGLELTRRLRINAQLRSAPIIVLTRGSRPQDGELALKAGADAFLIKPVAGDVLREHVTRLLVTSGRLPRPDREGCSRNRHVQPRFEASELHSPDTGSLRSGSSLRTNQRSCPRCCGPLEYRQRWPVLSPRTATLEGGESRERLHYQAGWFCANPSCDYQEVTRRDD